MRRVFFKHFHCGKCSIAICCSQPWKSGSKARKARKIGEFDPFDRKTSSCSFRLPLLPDLTGGGDDYAPLGALRPVVPSSNSRMMGSMGRGALAVG